MVAQPKLGLWTQWRAGPSRFDSDCPAALGSALKAGILANDYENPKADSRENDS
jgi:hypothetical protein